MYAKIPGNVILKVRGNVCESAYEWAWYSYLETVWYFGILRHLWQNQNSAQCMANSFPSLGHVLLVWLVGTDTMSTAHCDLCSFQVVLPSLWYFLTFVHWSTLSWRGPEFSLCDALHWFSDYLPVNCNCLGFLRLSAPGSCWHNRWGWYHLLRKEKLEEHVFSFRHITSEVHFRNLYGNFE